MGRATEVLAVLERCGDSPHDPVGKVMRDTLALLSDKQRAKVAAIKRSWPVERHGPHGLRSTDRSLCSRCQSKLPEGWRRGYCKRCENTRKRNHYRRTRAVKV